MTKRCSVAWSRVNGFCFRLLPIVLALLLIPQLGLAASFTGQVAGVIDGDTIEVMHEGKAERIRLHGIDCPENGQSFGKRAKEATSGLVFGKTVMVEGRGRDKYGRTIGDVFRDGLHVNQELVQDGWCWWFRKYAPNDRVLERLEAEARAAKKGLWRDPAPIPPWD